jgi:hypothetical protein
MPPDDPSGPAGRPNQPGRTGLITLAIVAVVHGGLARHSLLSNYRAYADPRPQVLAYGVLTALLVGCAVFLLRSRPVPHWFRIVGVATTLGASLLSMAGLPGYAFVGSMHWSILVIGWFGVLLLQDRLQLLGGFLAAHLLTVLVLLTRAGLPGRTQGACMATDLLAMTAQHFGFAVLLHVLRRCAARAEEASYQQARVEAEQAAADQVHVDQQRRFADLSHTVVPLLSGIAERELDPADPAVRHRCALEAARMRRLFTEADHPADPVVHDLGAGIEVAQGRGVVVTLATRGEPVPLPVELRRAITEPAVAAIATARLCARATVAHVGGQTRVSVVSDEPGLVVPEPSQPGVRIQTLVRDGRLWVSARASAPTRPADDRPRAEHRPTAESQVKGPPGPRVRPERL